MRKLMPMLLSAGLLIAVFALGLFKILNDTTWSSQGGLPANAAFCASYIIWMIFELRV